MPVVGSQALASDFGANIMPIFNKRIRDFRDVVKLADDCLARWQEIRDGRVVPMHPDADGWTATRPDVPSTLRWQPGESFKDFEPDLLLANLIQMLGGKDEPDLSEFPFYDADRYIGKLDRLKESAQKVKRVVAPHIALCSVQFRLEGQEPDKGKTWSHHCHPLKILSSEGDDALHSFSLALKELREQVIEDYSEPMPVKDELSFDQYLYPIRAERKWIRQLTENEYLSVLSLYKNRGASLKTHEAEVKSFRREIRNLLKEDASFWGFIVRGKPYRVLIELST